MKTKIFIFCAMLLIAKANAQTHVGGAISTNTLWTKVNSPYLMDSDVTVSPGITLTIEPGVTIQPNYTNLIINNATLIAQGTASDSIIFLNVHGHITIQGGNIKL